MIVSALLKAISHSAPNLERVKDDDADAGLGSWLVGDQDDLPAPTGVPGFGGSVIDATSGLIDNLAGWVDDSPLASITDVLGGDWVADWLHTWVLGSTGLLSVWWLFKIGWAVTRNRSPQMDRQRADAEWRPLDIGNLNQESLIRSMQAQGIRCKPGENPWTILVNAYHLGVAKRYVQSIQQYAMGAA